MMETRKIQKVYKSKPVMEGAGVRLKRAIGFESKPLFDPFLLFDDFRSGNPADYINGFPWHPHRGIETITYVLRGDIEHGDSMKNRGVISPGDVQWMTAGSGIIHQEMPRGDADGVMHGFQLWANLPASHKMMNPRYREVKSTEIPVITFDGGVTIKIISGTVTGTQGPVRGIVTDPEYLDIMLPASSRYNHPTRKGYTVFAYMIEGSCSFCNQNTPCLYEEEGANYFDYERTPYSSNGTLVYFGDGDQIEATAENGPARFLLISGRPIREPVAWRGPIVMNTPDELRIAFQEYQNGTFIKHK
ncbi:MAG: pirin family protein [Spirochaetes bacterium]|nr:pirin family protein [Spirochaetota bacterium]